MTAGTCRARAAALAAGLALSGGAGALDEPRREWNFTVYLDDMRIGAHRYSVAQEPGGRTELVTEASFDVRFLFINAYSYRHRNTERWNGGCLAAIEAHTDDNGERTRIAGTATGDAFVVSSPVGEQRLPACIMSFAYWNPQFLAQERLLNSQTGELLPVSVRDLGADRVEVRGQSVAAQRYAIDAGRFRIDLWYSPAREWLALDSTTESGRRLRYRLE